MSDTKTQLREIRDYFKVVTPYLRDSKWMIFAVSVSASMAGVTAMINIYLLKYFMENMLSERSVQFLWGAFGVFMGTSLLRGISQYVMGIKSARVKKALEIRIKLDVFRKYQQLPFEYFLKNTTGSLVNQIGRETSSISQSFSTATMLFQDFILVFIVGITAFRMNATYTAYALLFVPLTVGLAKFFFSKLTRISAEIQEHSSAMQQTVLENIQGIRVVRIFQAEDQQVGQFEKNLWEAGNRSIYLSKLSARIGSTYSLLNLSGGGLILYIGGLDVLAGKTSIAALVGFLAALAALFGPIGRFTRLYSNLLTQIGTGQRLFETLRMRDQMPEGDLELGEDVHSIAFEDVTFSYPGSGGSKKVLDGLNLSLQRGEILTILGPNGSGKSTLLNLIPRLFDPVHGRITINGFDMRHYRLQTLRKRIAVVAQEPFLFDDTIFSNILVGKPDASKDEVYAAARLAFAEEFILKLPEGYQTPVGEKGARLSGGQRQRLSIARAFLKAAPILILDEPTSSLDLASKDVVTQALQNLVKDRLVFVVTHDLTMIPPEARRVELVNGKALPAPAQSSPILGPPLSSTAQKEQT